MISDMDRERQFDSILDSAEGDREALLAAAHQIQRRDAGMSADLSLIALLSQTAPAKSEVDAARLRVGQRLTRDIFADPDDEDSQKRPLRALRLSEPPETVPYPAVSARFAPHTSAPAASRATTLARRTSWRRVIYSAVAAAALFFVVGGGLAVASAQSLPESPLYGVKRTEESILLALPLSDSARAQALSMIALRRLAEAQSEASEHHENEAQAILSQYNEDMRQLITLAATVNAQHGDSSAITEQIIQVIQTQQSIQQTAAKQGDVTFMQALSDSAATVSATLQQQRVTLPNADGSGQNNGKGHDVATATPTIIGPTPTAPGASGSHGHGHGNGNGDGNSNGSNTSTNH